MAQAYELISMPTVISTIFGFFHIAPSSTTGLPQQDNRRLR